MRVVLSLLVVLCALALLLPTFGAIGYPLQPTINRVRDGALTIGHLFRIDHLNPFIGWSNEAYIMYFLIYDALWTIDEDQNYVPNLAVNATPQDGARVWVYQIRQGVKWHDGTNLTAEDVAFSINYNIQNLWLLWAWEPYVETIVQCKPGEVPGQTPGCGSMVTGAWEVTVWFSEPFAPGNSGFLVPIIQKRQWQNVSATDAQYSYANRNPIGTGPYMADPNIYEQWVRGDPIVLHANPNYHLGAPKVESVIFKLFKDESSMISSLLAGQIDVTLLSASGYDAVQRSPQRSELIELQEGLTVIQYWTDIGIVQMNSPGINLALNPTRFDLNVRQAMAHATNKTFILEQFYRGKGIVGSTLVSPVQPYWHYEPTAEETFEYSLEKARAILDAAGYRDENGDGVREAVQDILLEETCVTRDMLRNPPLCSDPDVLVPKGTPLSFRMILRLEAPEEKEIAKYLKANWAKIGIEITGKDSPDFDVVEEFRMTDLVYGGGRPTLIRTTS